MKTFHVIYIAIALLMIGCLSSCDSDKELTVIEIPVTPYSLPSLWMVGDAAPAGWVIESPTPMNKIDYNVFQYEGELAQGEFKCPIEPGNWGGAFIMPATNGTIINRSGVQSDEISLMPTGDPDNKWLVTEAGRYSVTIDGNRHKIIVTPLN